MPIEWSENLKTGISIIDEQHHELVVLLNRLGRLRCGEASFNEAFLEFQDYIHIHFKTEEDYMKSLNYPKTNEHKITHDEFFDLVMSLPQKFKDTDSIDEATLELIASWLINHYTTEDVELADYIKKDRS